MVVLREDRNSQASVYRAGRLRLSELVRGWLDVNCWTPSNFACLTRGYCAPSGALSSREVLAVLSGSQLDLMPKYFQAFADVDAGVSRFDPRPSGPLSDLSLLSCFVHSASIDGSSSNPSWWFAIYCGEEWASLMVDSTPSVKSHGITPLGKMMPPLIRGVMARYGLDPVTHARRAALGLSSATSLRPGRYVDWILESSVLEDDEVRLALPFSLILMSELGLNCDKLHGIEKAAELCLNSLPPA